MIAAFFDRAESLRRGFAVAVDASTLLPTVRSAMLQISRTLLAPLHFTVTCKAGPESSSISCSNSTEA